MFHWFACACCDCGLLCAIVCVLYCLFRLVRVVLCSCCFVSCCCVGVGVVVVRGGVVWLGWVCVCVSVLLCCVW